VSSSLCFLWCFWHVNCRVDLRRVQQCYNACVYTRHHIYNPSLSVEKKKNCEFILSEFIIRWTSSYISSEGMPKRHFFFTYIHANIWSLHPSGLLGLLNQPR
jgi:hypothetical protein